MAKGPGSSGLTAKQHMRGPRGALQKQPGDAQVRSGRVQAGDLRGWRAKDSHVEDFGGSTFLSSMGPNP